MYDYVIIAFGFTEAFQASNKYSAVGIAHSIANREHLRSWLLYNNRAELIFEKQLPLLLLSSEVQK